MQEHLSAMIRTGRVGHAYVLEGAAGLGKTAVATWFSRAAVCEAQDGTVCGHCENCLKSAAGAHPDIVTVDRHFIQDDKIKEGSVDAMRLFRRDVFTKPFLAKRKVYILPHADQLLFPAQNSLLKVLEEPPAYCTIVLLCQNTAKLLDTVRSRLTVLRLMPWTDEEMLCYLTKQYGGELAKQILPQAGGNPGVADQLAQEEDWSAKRLIAARLLVDYLCGGQDVFAPAGFLEKQKEDLERFLQAFVLLMQEAVFLSVGQKMDNGELGPFAERLSSAFSTKRLLGMYDVLQQLLCDLHKNVNIPLRITQVLIQIRRAANG